MEITITPPPAQPLTDMVSVKSGRRNSKSDADKINQAISLLQDVLGELDDTEEPSEDEDEPKANEEASSKEQTEALMIRKGALQERIKNLHIMED